MKTFTPIIFILLIAGSLQACKHKASTEISDIDTEVTTQDSNVVVPGSAPDTTDRLNLVVDKEDSSFVMDVMSGNLAEIMLGKLAIKNGRSKQVKNFGQMMIKEHGKSNTKLVAIAQEKKLNLAVKFDAGQQKLIDQLTQKTGDDFDKAYITAMITDHQQDLKNFTDASTKIQDLEIKSFAIKSLPALQKHLDAINAIHDSMAQ